MPQFILFRESATGIYYYTQCSVPGERGTVDDDALASAFGRRSRWILRTFTNHERELWMILIGTVIVDILLTYVGIRYLGAVEHNPLAVAMFAEVGIIATGVLLKTWLLASLAIARMFVPHILFGYVLVVPTAVHTFICINNAIVLGLLL